MKQTVKSSRTLGYLEKIFRTINEDFFENKLEMPIITVQSNVRAYGHITTSKVWKSGERAAYELNISAEYLQRPIENVCGTLVHEMVHLYCLQNEIKDTSRGGTYHNKKFKELAERTELVEITHDKRIGWSVTSPTEKMLDYIIKQEWQDIDMGKGVNLLEILGKSGGSNNGNSNGGEKSTPKAKSSTRKYICPCCGQSVRATKEVNLICGDCMVKMEVQN